MNTNHIHNYRATIAYDGTAYAGWQIQPNGLAVQEVIERSLAHLNGAPVKLHGSGRTDRGVHARAQSANFTLGRRWIPVDLQRALNAVLPSDIRILKLTGTRTDFHARRSAVAKEYRYLIWNDEIMPPHLRLYRAHVRRPLDVAAMQLAAARLIGCHDFAAFSANPNRPVESTVRTLARLLVRRRGHDITIVARGNGFLYKMVRSLAGLLIRVGSGEVAPAKVKDILATRIRTAVVPTAPPQGLFLWQVFYRG
ncbi:MAG: tRNA pseudouridine(38-40) synthase TruA [Lentisphaerae bacterium]|nr:tRNA pseudouridine(38-40) synthase TruA [Lentisphaerota bacterium]